MTKQGHVFVVRRQLEGICCDAVIIPTDSSRSVRAIWHEAQSGATVPTEFSGYARGTGARDARSVWFVDVIGGGQRSLASMRKNLAHALTDITKSLTPDARSPAQTTTRERPLIALPMLGMGGGGLGEEAGHVIGGLLATLRDATDEVDIVLVAFRESDYAAIQWARRQDHGCAALPHSATARQLAEFARKDGLSLLIGAGVSMGAGLPGWTGLLQQCLPSDQQHLLGDDEFKSLGALDQAEYIARQLGNSQVLKKEIAAQIRKADKPALGHLLLSSLACHAVVTTNYDRLYEAAAKSQESGPTPKAIPYERPENGEPWLLKLHGDVHHEDDIVITRSDFVGYDAHSAPSGALFQSMLMTTHLLAVGVSFADDNVLRLTHEVAAFLRRGAATQSGPDTAEQNSRLGTVLSLGGDAFRAKIWDPELDWISIGESAGEKADDDARVAAAKAQARDLEIFLDHLAMHACRSSSYLLDKRYSSLLDGEAVIAEQVRAAAGQVPPKPQRRSDGSDAPGGGDRWKPLRDAFQAHGLKRSDRESSR